MGRMKRNFARRGIDGVFEAVRIQELRAGDRVRWWDHDNHAWSHDQTKPQTKFSNCRLWIVTDDAFMKDGMWHTKVKNVC